MLGDELLLISIQPNLLCDFYEDYNAKLRYFSIIGAYVYFVPSQHCLTFISSHAAISQSPSVVRVYSCHAVGSGDLYQFVKSRHTLWFRYLIVSSGSTSMFLGTLNFAL